MTDFESVQIASRREVVEEKLLEAIFRGQLLPGQAIREMELARAFRVSQATIREALVALEHGGLVERIPHKGSYIKNLTAKELLERIEVRIALETLACVLANKNGFSKKDYSTLEILAGDIVSQRPTADLTFHRYIWKHANNVTLLDELEHLSLSLFAFVGTLRAAGLQKPQDRLKSHREFIKALKTKQETAIRDAIRKHLESAYQGFLDSGAPDFRSLAERFRQGAFPDIESDVLASMKR